jgi:hypothetical protein
MLNRGKGIAKVEWSGETGGDLFIMMNIECSMMNNQGRVVNMRRLGWSIIKC